MEIIELVIMKSHLDSFKKAFKVHIGGELFIGEEKMNGEAVCVSFENKSINVSFLCQYEAKKIANELVEKMGIVTSSGWKNADCATQCALIAVERILELLPEFSLDYQIQSEHKLYKFVEKELKIKLENERLF